MLRKAPTQKMLEEWKKTFEEYGDKLKPNKKTGQETADFICEKFGALPYENKEFANVVALNVLNNECYAQKLKPGEKPKPKIFCIDTDEKRVFIGIDLISGMFHVEDDEDLWNEIFAFIGLDEYDIKNPYLVHEYVNCLKKLRE